MLTLVLLLSLSVGKISAAPANCGCADHDRILRLADPPMTGNDVVELQGRLQSLGFYQGSLDGVFNDPTAQALMAFQDWAGLEPDGSFGPKTQETLTMSIAEQSVSQATENPPEGELRIVISTEKKTLTVLVDDKVFKVFPCAVGKSSTKSPVGEWRVIQKGTHWGGGFGTRWMGLNVPWGIYGIHGTNKPGSIGTSASHGCIRMHNRDVEKLYPWVKVGTRVSIVGPYPKIRVSHPLHRGQSGKEVQQLQLSLREEGFNVGYTDGRYGEDTAQGVSQLQSFYGLKPTGEADTNVLLLLGLR